MVKVKDIISILGTYEKISTLVGAESSDGIQEFKSILKGYQNLTLEAFQAKLEENKKPAKEGLSPKSTALKLGDIYYQKSRGKSISNDFSEQLKVYLALPENKMLTEILDTSIEQRFLVIKQANDRLLTGNHLAFLGMALLNIKLKGRTKADQKKNLLDILWTVSENQAMNDIYENAL